MTHPKNRGNEAARTVGRMIRRERKKSNRTQKQLAAAIEALIAEAEESQTLSCHPSTVAHWEAGHWLPTLRIMPFVAKAAGIPLGLMQQMEEDECQRRRAAA